MSWLCAYPGAKRWRTMHLNRRLVAIFLAALPIAGSPCFIVRPGLAQQLTPVPTATLVGPICPEQDTVIVTNSTAGATLLLQVNSNEHGRRSAVSGDVSLAVDAPTHL